MTKVKSLVDGIGNETLTEKYYDSWALRDIQGNSGLSYSSNPFVLSEDRDLWSSGLRVSVQSAFGGAALVRGNLFKTGNIRWSGENGCEHWYFCEKIRNSGSEIRPRWAVRPR